MVETVIASIPMTARHAGQGIELDLAVSVLRVGGRFVPLVPGIVQITFRCSNIVGGANLSINNRIYE
jgi:hypothetical protein